MELPGDLSGAATAPGPAPEAPRPGLRYLTALDGLRGVAIILVLLHNFTTTGAPIEPLLARLLEWGWVGVQLFLVLSGYLITRNLLATPLTRGTLTAFLIRRCLRVMPICYALLALYFHVVPVIFHAPTIEAARSTQLWYWLFLSNWTEPFGLAAPGLGHLWSLGVEVQFYVVWPLVLLAVGPKHLGRACVATIVLALVCAVALRTAGASPMAVYKFTITRMNALAFGALVAILAPRRDLAIPVRALTWSTAGALAALVVWRGGFDYRDAMVATAGLTLSALLFALWLLPLARATSSRLDPTRDTLAGRVLSSAALRSVGRVSYGMYVAHYPLHWAALKKVHPLLLDPDGAVATWMLAAYVVTGGVATYLLAQVVWILLEGPVLKLKRHVPPTGVRRPTVQLTTLAAQGLAQGPHNPAAGDRTQGPLV
jgi:peptidoglycan/LPS O-acetylase OafA/YrhL